MTRFILICACAALPLTAIAQDDDAVMRDRSLIQGFLEDNLSGAGRDIRIEGFRGALSSQAKLDELTIADDDGIWFTLRDAVLDWDRAALLRGRVDINRISAGEIIIARLPSTDPKAPSPEATPFSLPELPVSISIDAIEAERVSLGAPVLRIGTHVDLSVSGTMQLADGSGMATLDIARLNGPAGAFNVDVSYTNATEQLDLNLALTEGKGGLIATLSNLPGAPDIALTAVGSGPLDAFVTDITLATQGQERLNGSIALKAEPSQDEGAPSARRFVADLSGDLTPLFASDYSEFFGSSSRLEARGISYPDGQFDLEQFGLSTQALSLSGALNVASDGLPSAFALSGTLATPTGRATLLPLTGTRTFVDKAQIVASYDSRAGDAWSARATLDGFARDQLRISRVEVDGNGTIERTPQADVSTFLRAIAADVAVAVTGFQTDNGALQEAIGDSLSGAATLAWQEGDPLIIDRLDITTGATEFYASGSVGGFESGFEYNGGLVLDTPRLARFAALSGLALSGATEVSASGRIVPLAGAFDVFVEGTGYDLAVGVPQADALLGGTSRFELTAKRDETGLTLEGAELDTPAVSARASGTVAAQAGDITARISLDDVARLNTGLSGPLTIDATMTHGGATTPWTTRADLVGPGGATARVAGSIVQDFKTANLSITGRAPLGLANTFTTAALVQGTAAFDLALSGPLTLNALSGQISITDGTRIVLPDAGVILTLSPSRIDLARSQATLNVLASPEQGGSLSVTGTVGLTRGLPANLSTTLTNFALEDPNLYSTSLNGTLTLRGPLVATPTLAGTLTLGETEIQVAPSALGAGGEIPEIVHIKAAASVQATRVRAGVVNTGEQGGKASTVGLNLTVRAPNQVYIRGRGLDAELGGQLSLRGTTADIIPVGQFTLVRGRLSILGKRIDLDEGELAVSGDIDPTFRLVGATSTDDLTIQIITQGRISAPELTLTSSPELPDEEILSQLLFGRALTEISALQAAQMAAAVATLTGGGGDLSGSIRKSFGLDDIDLTTSENGDAALKVGKYLSEKIYTDVTIDSSGKSEINLNLDASKNVTVKGSLSTDGNTSLGVFFEKDY
ncbi:translocation and assembly module TamB [Celeribacter marinus]|uniref:Gramicidin S biosynthesis grst protein n=2 Tax=Celeribacter marinus TaxID=1397108 RepID=A0A0N7HJ20_9RHOB|nr:gramicidin S biosynthesis grst protein [Celeribacter marinus]SFL00027.1 translocation and assembly module TamB [Celeribacter marinus]